MVRRTFPVALLLMGVAVLQLLFFVPVVGGGGSVSFGGWLGSEALFRVDALGLAFGVVWAFSLGLGLLVWGRGEGLAGLQVGLLIVGLLPVAYAREPLVLAIGWEVAALGAYWGFYREAREGERWRLVAFLHGPGLFVFALAAFGLLRVFEPPEGGAGFVWPLAVTLPVGMAVLWRALYRPENEAGGMPELYAACAPFLLAKMLVAGRWDAWGTWALALVGTIALLAWGWQVARSEGGGATPARVLAILCLVGFALAPLSPMAGVGAVILLALAALLAGGEESLGGRAYRGGLALAGGVAGLWLVSQGALSARYGVVVAVALPVIMLTLSGKGVGERVTRSQAAGVVAAIMVIILGLGAVFPQLVVEWMARPAAQAMAGGVGAATDLVSNWGIGLQVVSPAEVVLAALPATGIAVAVFLAWAVLYWVRGVIRDT
jgi:hypothetical protein